MKIERLDFIDLLDKIIKEDERRNVFLYKKAGFIKGGDLALLVEDEEYDAPEEIEDYVCSLSWAQVNDIISNLKSQISYPTLEDYIEAINYYIENDAFIDLEEDKGFLT